jgi:polyhydroxyalkanoate synthesis regulator phasin
MKTSSESLAAIIITNRVLNLYKDEAKQCMSELLRRREDEDDTFEFEKYIDDQIQKIEDENKNIQNKGLQNLVSSILAIKDIT